MITLLTEDAQFAFSRYETLMASITTLSARETKEMGLLIDQFIGPLEKLTFQLETIKMDAAVQMGVY